MELGRNLFADAVRRVAAMAPAVDRRVMGAGKALAVGLALLAAPVLYAQGVSPMGGEAIRGSAAAAQTARQAVETARVQGHFATAFACGLLKVAKVEIGHFQGTKEIARIQSAASTSLDEASRLPRATSSLGQTVDGVATMARTLAMAGLSSAAETVIDSKDVKEWASTWRAELTNVTGTLARSAHDARVNRDLNLVADAAAEIDETAAELDCAGLQPRI